MQEYAKYWYLHDHQLFSVLSREENRALGLIPVSVVGRILSFPWRRVSSAIVRKQLAK